MVGRGNRCQGIASLRLHEGEGVVAEGKVGAEGHRTLELDHRVLRTAQEPEGAPHRQMGCGVMLIDHHAVASHLVGQVAFTFRSRPSLEGMLPVGEGESGIGSCKGGVRLDGLPKVVLRLLIVLLGEAVHVPEATVIGFPSVEGTGRLENGAVSFRCFHLVCEAATILSPISSRRRKVCSCFRSNSSDQRIWPLRVSTSSTVTSSLSPDWVRSPLVK